MRGKIKQFGMLVEFRGAPKLEVLDAVFGGFSEQFDFKDGSCRRIRSRDEGRVVDSYTLSEILQSHDAISKPK